MNVASTSATKQVRFLVEPLRPDVCRRGPQEKGQPDARIFELAVALGRGVREDQR